MDNMHNWYRLGLNAAACLALAIMAGGCGQKAKAPETYRQQLADIATQYAKLCPKEMANGTRLETVAFHDNTMLFRVSLDDQAIANINLDQARDSIVSHISDNLRRFLVQGKCSLEYRYVSQNDSSLIVILPDELGGNEADVK